MPTSESAKAQKRLRKVEQAHTRLADLAKRIDAQAAAIANLMAEANRIVADSATKAASTRAAHKTAPATRKAAPAARKPAARKPATRKPAIRKVATRTRGSKP